MIIECTSCGSKYKYDESKLAGASSKKVKCPKCKGVIEVINQSMPPVDPEHLERTVAAVPTQSHEAQPSPGGSSLDDSAGSAVASPKTSKVRLDTLTQDPDSAIAESLLKMPE